MLRIFVAWECEQNGEVARFSPYLLEAGFGFALSGTPPLDITAGDVQFRLHGVIDRLDRDDAGNLRVLDYKSGSTTYSGPDLEKGLALQTVLYALAAEQYWAVENGQVAESLYWHIPSREASGKLEFQGPVQDNARVEIAVQQAGLNVIRVRDGVFPSAPGKPAAGGSLCRSSCDFGPLCRVSRQSIRKAQNAGVAS